MKVSDERVVAPVIGMVISIAIVFILTCLDSSVFFADYVDSFHEGSPAAKIQVYFTDDESSLEVKGQMVIETEWLL